MSFDFPKIYVVLCIRTQDKPFIFYNEYDEQGNKLEGNDRFTGYCVDLIRMIKHIVEKNKWGNLNYEMHLVNDGQYGIPQDSNKPTESAWNGMVGELMRNVSRAPRGGFFADSTVPCKLI